MKTVVVDYSKIIYRYTIPLGGLMLYSLVAGEEDFWLASLGFGCFMLASLLFAKAQVAGTRKRQFQILATVTTVFGAGLILFVGISQF